MKARKKGTNDPFEEIDCIQFKDRYDVYPVSMIEFENESEGNKPNVEYWEQLRHKAAIAAMQSMLANPGLLDESSLDYRITIEKAAVGYANELVEQLKKK